MKEFSFIVINPLQLTSLYSCNFTSTEHPTVYGGFVRTSLLAIKQHSEDFPTPVKRERNLLIICFSVGTKTFDKFSAIKFYLENEFLLLIHCFY